MSGKPNATDIKLLLAAIRKREDAMQQIVITREVIANAKMRMDEARQELVIVESEAIRLMDRMDCTGSGNTGWQLRILALLGELERQARTGAGDCE